jgi:hypothetical protein
LCEINLSKMYIVDAINLQTYISNIFLDFSHEKFSQDFSVNYVLSSNINSHYNYACCMYA